jgi:predicted CXXCH cytochrome family protein
MELIQASGGTTYEAYIEKGALKTALVLGAGRTKKESCLACHDQAKDLKEAANKKLMHQKHVTVKNARCLECHEPIKHSLDGLKQSKAKATTGEKLASGKDYVRDSCLACHPEPHRKQLFLTAGQKLEGVIAAPSPHETARASCLACHRVQGTSKKGQRVLKASDQICISCHKGRTLEESQAQAFQGQTG